MGAPGLDVYVAPDGSDSNPGTASQPFATVHRAQQAVRAFLAATPTLAGNVSVHLAPAQYVMPQPLTINASDSGRDGFYVKYVASSSFAWKHSDQNPHSRHNQDATNNGTFSAPTSADTATLLHGVMVPSSLWQRHQGSVLVANISSLAPPSDPSGSCAAAPTPPCGLIEPGIDYYGNDLYQVQVPDLAECCQKCADEPRCNAWMFCDPSRPCGRPGHPTNCYLKTSADGRTQFVNVTSGTLCSSSLASARNVHQAPAWRVFHILEDGVSGTLARTPNAGSGYLRQLSVKNSNTGLTWPEGALPDTFSWQDASVFCNLGADWFSETRTVTGADFAQRSITYDPGSGSFTCNDKVYLQGPKELLDEPGEWALDHQAGLLYLWPRSGPDAVLNGSAQVFVPYGPRVVDVAGTSATSLAQHVQFVGLTLQGGDFTRDGTFHVFPPSRSNSCDERVREGLLRIENASDIHFLSGKLTHGALSGVWLEGRVTNVTVRDSVLAHLGLSGLRANGIFPGDTAPDITTAAESDRNKYHLIHNNLIYATGKRVGHGGGIWLFQSGALEISRNLIQEAPRNAVGIFGIRFGTLPGSLYGKQLDFFSALDVLHTRRIRIVDNEFKNLVRDTCDAGAVEFWGVGANNTVHNNAFSDMDSGGMDGSWMNFMFSDDASHFLNVSNNLIYEVKGKGSEEATMQKSVSSVFENNVVAQSTLGHLANVCPYIEPAANIVFSRNLWYNISTTDSALDITINSYTTSTLRNSCSLFKDPKNVRRYNFTDTTTPSLSDPVVAEFDYNLYWNVESLDTHTLPDEWDAHAVAKDPQFQLVHTGSQQRVFNLTAADFALASTSPAFQLPGFRPLQVDRMGLDRASFPFAVDEVLQRDGTDKIQAETYSRMRGLWHAGSFAITPGPHNFPFASDAWALYDHVDVACPSPCTVVFRAQPLGPVAVAFAVRDLHSVIASLTIPAATPSLGLYNVTVPQGVQLVNAPVFLLLNASITLDWFKFVSAGAA